MSKFEKTDAQKWWLEKSTQDATIELMKQFNNIFSIFADVKDGEIVLKILTFNDDVQNFPKHLLGKKIIVDNVY